MIVSEILRTCSHDKVAHAAVASLGPAFMNRVQRAADKRGQQAGAFVAASVKHFETVAGERERSALQKAVAGFDMPLLRGLALIVEHEMDGTCGLEAQPRDA